ncbi:MAG: DivIVA domain-containing protein [Bacteroidetes bacterium]|nr:DivIVA domain-containing protein [Bacteroidota bacterium]MBU1113650.1 DivIVA domain-containing protein [Bacteroidota bacterium]MBU1796774.1 DivIVA domain-containing protein [Bacteroidota bacterium]
MKFTPYSIKAQDFNKAFRGFDKDEVRAYLSNLANEFDKLQIENNAQNDRILNTSEEISEFKKLEKTLQLTLVSAQESTSKAVESARKQSQLIIKEAEIRANQIIEKANKEAEVIRSSVLQLREERNLLIAKLKAIVETQANILDIGSETFASKSLPIEVKQNDNSEIDLDDVLEKLL